MNRKNQVTWLRRFAAAAVVPRLDKARVLEYIPSTVVVGTGPILAAWAIKSGIALSPLLLGTTYTVLMRKRRLCANQITICIIQYIIDE